MKQKDKIKVSVLNIGDGTYHTSIEYPDGKQERKTIGYSLFGRAICINKKLDERFSDGDTDFYLTEGQYSAFCSNLIAFN